MQTKPGMFESWLELLKWPLTVSMLIVFCGIGAIILLCYAGDVTPEELAMDAWRSLKQ